MRGTAAVEALLRGPEKEILFLRRTQVGAVANMSALLMKQMLEGAEQQGAGLTFDTSSVEDQGKREFVTARNKGQTPFFSGCDCPSPQVSGPSLLPKSPI